MTLNEIEKYLEEHYGVKYPKKIHEIYDTGVMEWLECEESDFKENRERFMNNPEEFMFSLDCDCELFMFHEIKFRISELNEWLTWRFERKEEVLKKGSVLIPFSMTGGGDVYYFYYETKDSEPMIFLLHHDDIYGNAVLWGENFDEFLYAMMLRAAYFDEDINGDVWKSHLYRYEIP